MVNTFKSLFWPSVRFESWNFHQTLSTSLFYALHPPSSVLVFTLKSVYESPEFEPLTISIWFKENPEISMSYNNFWCNLFFLLCYFSETKKIDLKKLKDT